MQNDSVINGSFKEVSFQEQKMAEVRKPLPEQGGKVIILLKRLFSHWAPTSMHTHHYQIRLRRECQKDNNTLAWAPAQSGFAFPCSFTLMWLEEQSRRVEKQPSPKQSSEEKPWSVWRNPPPVNLIDRDMVVTMSWKKHVKLRKTCVSTYWLEGSTKISYYNSLVIPHSTGPLGKLLLVTNWSRHITMGPWLGLSSPQTETVSNC